MSARMTWPEMEANMATVGELRARIKERSTIFNVTEKEYAARFYGMPLDSFYHIEFTRWIDVSRHYNAALVAGVRS